MEKYREIGALLLSERDGYIAGRINESALTTKKPYKPAFSNEEALGEIKKGEGSHFDPVVSGAFLKCIDEILSIQKRFQEETANQIIR